MSYRCLVFVGAVFVLITGLAPPVMAQVDSDGDGAPDAWELNYGLDPQDGGDLVLDPDGDCLNSWFEYAFDRNPIVPELLPALTVELAGNGESVVVMFDRRTDDSNLHYQLERTSSLAAPIEWRSDGFQFITGQPAANREVERARYQLDALSSALGQQFVRLSLHRLNGAPVREDPENMPETMVTSRTLLESSLQDELSIVSPETGLGGSSNLVEADFIPARSGGGARFESNRFLRFPVSDGTQSNLLLEKGELEFWFRPNFGAGDSNDDIHALITVGPIYDVPRLTLSESDEFRLSVVDQDWVTVATSAGYRTPLWAAGEWVHIRALWDRSNQADSLQLYVNEKRVDQGGAGGGWDLGSGESIGDLFVGTANEVGDFPADGVIDELIIRDAPQINPHQSLSNALPVIVPLDPPTGIAGELLTFVVEARDPDGDSLSYSLADGAPGGAMIDSISGRFSWSIGEDQTSGAYPIIVRVSDDHVPPASAEISITLNVFDEGAEVSGPRNPSLDAVLQPASIPLQQVGVPFVDPVFGTTLRRVSDTSDRGGFESQIYNQLQAFSADNQYMLLVGSDGYLVRRVDNFQQVEGLDMSDWNVPRWHPTRTNTLVHYDTNADETVRVQFSEIDTLRTTTVFAFPAQYRSIQGNPSFEELSRDGRWMAGVVTRNDQASVIFSLDLEARSLGAEVSIADIYAQGAPPDPEWGELQPDWVGVSPLGIYLMVQWARDDVTRASGLESWNIRTGEYVGRVTNHRHHGDLGLAADGVTEIFVTADFSPPFNSDGQATVYHELPGPTDGFSPHRWLRSVPWTDEDHISMQGPPGTAVVSWGNLDDRIDSPMEDELFIQRMDGSVQRLLHHRSTVSDYWVQPRASISRDGRYVIFASDWNRNTGGRGDPYLIDLEAGGEGVNPADESP